MSSNLGLLGAAYNSDNSGDDSSEESSSSSLDSAQERALTAEARLRDYGEVQGPGGREQGPPDASQPTEGKVLPSADAVFNEVGGVPEFLDPECTRPLAVSLTHGKGGGGPQGASSGAHSHQASGKGSKGQVPGEDFDISRLAPSLKGQKRAEPGTVLRPGAVIEGKAKRYKADEEGAPVYSDVQVAMLGGQVNSHTGGEQGVVGPVGPTAPPKPSTATTKVRTKPEAVDSFLDKGLGGQQLPRKNQDRKEREKMKREKGQSTHREWKSEAEMALRQQYD